MDKKADKPAKGKRAATMSRAKSRSPSAERVRRHRERMKAMGLKPVTIWVPDVDTPEFKAQLARAIDVINEDEESRRVLEGMLELGDFSDWR
ncbi:conserved hypothetical protein [Rhodopseudomonas palustris HaA2]|uniref:DUF3018 family protein n=1 Tax=Rhodopseudomonas palustris (strain HaA2) TaxID=316058 RepID=Q2IRK8_RHOP2|nr:antitoxin MazE family protein [Rhodopseudomonas palustris]ABD09152.1 conserved hypothetical protein [Rhodopseudomonas palustris HaA2]